MTTLATRSVDELVAEMVQGDHAPLEIRVAHVFTPGLYTRSARVMSGQHGSLIVTEAHLTEHPFAITGGEAWVFSTTEGTAIFKAGHIGITKPGTQRILFVPPDTELVWTTFHATEETDVAKIGSQILAPYENSFLGNDPRLRQWLDHLPTSDNHLG